MMCKIKIDLIPDFQNGQNTGAKYIRQIYAKHSQGNII